MTGLDFNTFSYRIKRGHANLNHILLTSFFCLLFLAIRQENAVAIETNTISSMKPENAMLPVMKRVPLLSLATVDIGVGVKYTDVEIGAPRVLI